MSEEITPTKPVALNPHTEDPDEFEGTQKLPTESTYSKNRTKCDSCLNPQIEGEWNTCFKCKENLCELCGGVGANKGEWICECCFKISGEEQRWLFQEPNQPLHDVFTQRKREREDDNEGKELKRKSEEEPEEICPACGKLINGDEDGCNEGCPVYDAGWLETAEERNERDSDEEDEEEEESEGDGVFYVCRKCEGVWLPEECDWEDCAWKECGKRNSLCCYSAKNRKEAVSLLRADLKAGFYITEEDEDEDEYSV